MQKKNYIIGGETIVIWKYIIVRWCLWGRWRASGKSHYGTIKWEKSQWNTQVGGG